RLVEADEALLDQVVAVAAGEEVRRRLEAHEAVVAAHQAVGGRRIPLLGKGDQVTILDLNLRLRIGGQTGHERSFRPAGSHAGGLGVAQWRNPPRSAICIEFSPWLNLKSSL